MAEESLQEQETIQKTTNKRDWDAYERWGIAPVAPRKKRCIPVKRDFKWYEAQETELLKQFEEELKTRKKSTGNEMDQEIQEMKDAIEIQEKRVRDITKIQTKFQENDEMQWSEPEQTKFMNLLHHSHKFMKFEFLQILADFLRKDEKDKKDKKKEIEYKEICFKATWDAFLNLNIQNLCYFCKYVDYFSKLKTDQLLSKKKEYLLFSHKGRLKLLGMRAEEIVERICAEKESRFGNSQPYLHNPFKCN